MIKKYKMIAYVVINIIFSFFIVYIFKDKIKNSLNGKIEKVKPEKEKDDLTWIYFTPAVM